MRGLIPFLHHLLRGLAPFLKHLVRLGVVYVLANGPAMETKIVSYAAGRGTQSSSARPTSFRRTLPPLASHPPHPPPRLPRRAPRASHALTLRVASSDQHVPPPRTHVASRLAHTIPPAPALTPPRDLHARPPPRSLARSRAPPLPRPPSSRAPDASKPSATVTPPHLTPAWHPARTQRGAA